MMDLDESVIEILDSPHAVNSKSKLQRDDSDGDNSEGQSRPAPKHPLLDSIGSRFQQNKAEREERNALFHSKQEMEKVHSEYLKQNVVDPQEMARASYAASHWAKKNGIKDSTLKPAQKNVSGAITPGKRKRQSTRQAGNQISKRKSTRTETVTSSATATVGTDTSTVTSASLITPRLGTVVDSDKQASSSNRRAAHNIRYPSDDASAAKYICPVLYCEAEFSSEGSLGQHMNLFQHSPCDPCRYLTDGKLPPDPLCYKCPECDLEFSTKQLCSYHIAEENHLPFFPPLAISAYLCPQCLYLFETLESCWNHMEGSRHHQVRFPFKEDDLDFSLPVAVAEELVQDYIRKCRREPVNVQCLDCGMNLQNPALFRDHQAETNNMHMVCALTTSSLYDVFNSYVEPFSCETCHRLFSELPESDPRHICAGGVIGHIKVDQIRTMSEFVKSCALTLMPSLKGKLIRNNIQISWKSDSKKKPDPSKIIPVQCKEKCDSIIVIDDTQRVQGEDVNEDLNHSNKIRRIPGSYKVIGENKMVRLENSEAASAEEEDLDQVRAEPVETSDDDVVIVKENFASLEMLTNEFSRQGPSKTSNAGDRIFNYNFQDSESNDKEISDALESDDRIFASDTDKNLDTSFELESQNNGYRNEINENQTGKTPRYCADMDDIRSSRGKKRKRKGGKLKSKGKRVEQELAKGRTERAERRNNRKTSSERSAENAEPQPGTSKQSKVVGKPETPSMQDDHLISTENLQKMKNLVLLDLDNFPQFFKVLPHCPSDHTFVWAFYGGDTVIKRSLQTETYREMRQRGLVYISERCGKTKDAADFALVLTVGKMDERLPSSVTFTIISADKGFCEVVRQMKQSQRSALLINPHKDKEILLTMLKSIVET